MSAAQTKTYFVRDTLGQGYVIRADHIETHDGVLAFQRRIDASIELVAMFSCGQWVSCIRQEP